LISQVITVDAQVKSNQPVELLTIDGDSIVLVILLPVKLDQVDVSIPSTHILLQVETTDHHCIANFTSLIL
jgi:hypothetical protein